MLPKISLLATGGTIASLASDAGLVPGMSAQDILGRCPSLANAYQISATDVFSLDSSNIQPHHWSAMARAPWRRTEASGPWRTTSRNRTLPEGPNT